MGYFRLFIVLEIIFYGNGSIIKKWDIGEFISINRLLFFVGGFDIMRSNLEYDDFSVFSKIGIWRWIVCDNVVKVKCKVNVLTF